MPPPPLYVSQQFEECEPSGPTVIVRCKHYIEKKVLKSMAKRKEAHLRECKGYRDYLEQFDDDELDVQGVPAQLRARGSDGAQRTFSKAGPSKAALNRLATAAVYEGGLAFNHFDSSKHPAMVEFIRGCNPDYIPPGRKRLANELLDKAYTEAKSAVDKILAATEYLNFICDELDAINSDRIANLYINTSEGQLFHIEFNR